MNKNFLFQRGFAAFYLIVLILALLIAATGSFALLVLNRQKEVNNSLNSFYSYFAAEAGIEDALLRLAKNKLWTNPIVLNVGDGHSTTTISAVIGGARVIAAEGNVRERIRKINAVYQIDTQKVSFTMGRRLAMEA